MRYRFGSFELDARERRLTRAGGAVRLQPKAFDLLVYLVEHSGRLVTKDHILSAVWPGVVVTESSLTQTIHQLRQALGDTRGTPLYIETVSRKGYRFLVEVEVEREQDAAPASPGTPPAHSVAVLPFANLTGDPAREHVCDGISEEILNRLARVPGLKVIARASSFAFKDTRFDAPRLSELLGVRHLLEGSVRSEGQMLRITARLGDRAGFQVWSGTFDGAFDRIFDVLDDIVRGAASFLLPQVAPPPASVATPDIKAYEHFLIGREIVQRRIRWHYPYAIEQLGRAIDIDTTFAAAYAERAIVLVLFAFWADDYQRQLERAERDVTVALTLDPNLARGHSARALLTRQRDPGSQRAVESSLRRALALDPNAVDVRYWLAESLQEQGRHSEADSELAAAAQLDPVAPQIITTRAHAAAEAGDVDDAERRLAWLLEVPQLSERIYVSSIVLHMETGRLSRAVAMAKRFLLSTVAVGAKPMTNVLAATYARLEMWEPAEYWFERYGREWPDLLQARLQRSYVLGHGAATLASRGRYADAIRLFDEVLDRGNVPLARIAPYSIANYGVLHALAGNHDTAVQLLAPLIDAPPIAARLRDHADVVHALVWSQRQLGENARASALLSTLDRRMSARHQAGRLRTGSLLHAYAQHALLCDDLDGAGTRLQEAVERGWRDCFRVQRDPRWQVALDAPGIRELLETVASAVAAQRAQVQAADDVDDFVRHLDVALAQRA